MKSKKGSSLTLSTVIIFILAIIVLIFVIMMLLSTSNPISDMFKTQANHTISSLPIQWLKQQKPQW